MCTCLWMCACCVNFERGRDVSACAAPTDRPPVEEKTVSIPSVHGKLVEKLATCKSNAFLFRWYGEGIKIQNCNT